MFKKISALLLIAMTSLPSINPAFAHGEDAAGPNSGVIRMPGGFHTEVKLLGDREFAVYLLDMNWEKPTVRNSTVEARVLAGNQNLKFECAPEKERFVCKLPQGISLQSAKELGIRAKREGVPGSEAQYPLPLVIPPPRKAGSTPHH